MHNDPKERREHLRVYRNFILTYHEKSNSSLKHGVSQVSNVSKGGLSFSSTHPIQQGTVIMVDLKTPFIADSIRVEGSVLECKEKIPGMIYDVRLKFQEISKHVLTILEKIERYGKAKEA